MLTLPSGKKIDESQAPEVFLDIVTNDDNKVVERVLKVVLECDSGSMKVSFLNAVSVSLSVELVRLQQATSDAQRGAIDRNISFIRSVHQQISQDIESVFKND